MRQGLKSYLLPCLLLLCLALPQLWRGDFRRDSGRYAAVGLYMWSQGNLLAPQIAPATPYFNKPPLAIVIHGWFLHTFGSNIFVARLPSVAAALGVLLLSMLAARQVGSKTEANVSGLVLGLTLEFTRRTRAISLDFWQLLFLMLAVFLCLAGLKRRSFLLVTLSGIGIGLALLCKPFVALGVFPVFAAWILLARQPRLLAALAGSLVVALLVALPWHAYMYAHFGQSFIRQYFFNEVIGRVKGYNGSEPIYYYALQLLTIYWPWLPVCFYAIWQRWKTPGPVRRPQRDLVLIAGLWVGWVFILISLFTDKSPNYALPMYPLLSWIVAAGLCRWQWPRLQQWYLNGLKGLAPVSAAMFVLLSILPVRFDKGPIPEWQALFGWMQAHAATPSQLAQRGLKPNDRCYFYVRTGWWLPDAPANSDGGPPWILIPRPEGSNQVAEAAFCSGNLQLIPNPGGQGH